MCPARNAASPAATQRSYVRSGARGGVTKQKYQTKLPGPVRQTRPMLQALVVTVHLLLHWFSPVCTQFQGRALTAARPNVYVMASALGHPEFPPAVRGRCEQYISHHEDSNTTIGYTSGSPRTHGR